MVGGRLHVPRTTVPEVLPRFAFLDRCSLGAQEDGVLDRLEPVLGRLAGTAGGAEDGPERGRGDVLGILK